ncbi:SpoIVB peptidase [Fuchsiella alkaliacetigena]|uniref:SpoIVB peptidase n=1 Tax=Fuchsiella alkaliacetigena TaxID=957042 RepID=UPI00200B8DA2|nr:SpoIVB peptidase [Fuchsiella alkaliacetigena]MCK8825435.1 SpoIVB peptidase [Fuchsiella alkaliacetigena]
MKRRRKYLVYSFLVLLLIITLTPQLLTLVGFPESFQVIRGNRQLLNINFPFEVYIRTPQEAGININGQQVNNDYHKVNLSQPLAIEATTVGEIDLEFNLFGVIPLRRTVVNVIPEVEVYPGGQSIGVIMESEGIMVVQKSYVLGEDEQKYYPSRQADINVGDRILAVNGERIKNKNELAKLIDYYGRRGENLELKIQRGRKVVEETLEPVQNQFGRYMVGLYVDDKTTGIGTLTFYEEESGSYGALGHMIAEPNTQLRIPVDEGKIVKADVAGIEEGNQGFPGEKLSTFFNGQDPLGIIERNTSFGIYGRLNKPLNNPFFSEAVPIATALQVEEGPAKMYTVVEGGKIEEFTVEIERVRQQYQAQEKGLVIKVTDSDLINRTGGIIQGMSGSPIVQNSKLVGAVTHVFVDDSQRGYGILAEWMIEEAGIIEQEVAKELGS